MVALRLGLSVLLGILACALSYQVLRRGVATVDLTVAVSDLKAGVYLKEEMLDKEPIRVDPKFLQSAVPFADRGVALEGRRLRRDVRRGEVLFFEDVRPETADKKLPLEKGKVALLVSLKNVAFAPALLRVGQQVGFVLAEPAESEPAPAKAGAAALLDGLGKFAKSGMNGHRDAARGKAGPAPKEEPVLPRLARSSVSTVGPYTIVSIGERTDPRDARPAAFTADAALISVAVDKKEDGKFDEPTNRLIGALNAGGNSAGDSRIVALVFYPEDELRP